MFENIKLIEAKRSRNYKIAVISLVIGLIIPIFYIVTIVFAVLSIKNQKELMNKLMSYSYDNNLLNKSYKLPFFRTKTNAPFYIIKTSNTEEEMQIRLKQLFNQ